MGTTHGGSFVVLLWVICMLPDHILVLYMTYGISMNYVGGIYSCRSDPIVQGS